jgi:hypothetical protein
MLHSAAAAAGLQQTEGAEAEGTGAEARPSGEVSALGDLAGEPSGAEEGLRRQQGEADERASPSEVPGQPQAQPGGRQSGEGAVAVAAAEATAEAASGDEDAFYGSSEDKTDGGFPGADNGTSAEEGLPEAGSAHGRVGAAYASAAAGEEEQPGGYFDVPAMGGSLGQLEDGGGEQDEGHEGPEGEDDEDEEDEGEEDEGEEDEGEEDEGEEGDEEDDGEDEEDFLEDDDEVGPLLPSRELAARGLTSHLRCGTATRGSWRA